ncbi:MAG TPA: F0F1 ATP synthase subunit delta [Pseudonocardiaceae bacterium]|jgi:F-type H+-transporting ATPase subunit delta|nr:F0F1 ATP synthase subunit delta [Pseudonocardiaceae bacterium]
MQAASRESLAAAGDRITPVLDAADAGALRTLGDELFAVLQVLTTERVLRRHLADPSTEADARKALADRVFTGKIGDTALAQLGGLVSSRWSSSADLLDAIELLSRRALLAIAEKDGSGEDVEDELFRFGRILDGQPRLRTLLADTSHPVDGRVSLLDGLIEAKVSPVTRALLEQAVRLPRDVSLELLVARLAELAAAQRDRSVAHVTAAAPLTDEQERRLAQVLGTIFGRPVSVQVELDPDVLGGLVIRVGDEVIDGSVAARLAKARQDLPS